MKRIIYLFYNYYRNGARKEIAYISALFAVITLLMLNALILLLLLTGKIFIFDYLPKSKGTNFLFFFIFLSLCTFILRAYYPKKVIETYNYEGNIRIAGWLLFTYLIISVLLLAYLMMNRNINFKLASTDQQGLYWTVLPVLNTGS
jgi:hypothetical protein